MLLAKIPLALVTATAVAFGGTYVGVGKGMGGIYALASSSRDSRVEATKPTRRIIIGIDLSRSNPITDDPGFAAKVAQRVRGMIEGMGFASEIYVRTFGAYNSNANSFYYDAKLSIRSRPDVVAAEVAKLISSTPALIRAGRWRAQNTTNVLAFLDNAANSFGCNGMPTDVVLASDGLEDSEYAHMKRPGAQLPAPRSRAFRGCQGLYIFGLGRGQDSPAHTIELRNQWQRWAQAAGFVSFTGLNDW
jgi:hypothetical protein